MAGQTVNKDSISDILDKVDNFYMCQTYNYFTNKDYGLGKEVDIEKFKMIKKIDDIVERLDCNDDDKMVAVNLLNSVLNK